MKDRSRQRELAQNFDCKKYPIVFEWGRKAQELPREAEPLASALAALNDAYIPLGFQGQNRKLFLISSP